ncbi:MAG: ATPase domain-containing protein, partial [Burkholderiales bacterium]
MAKSKTIYSCNECGGQTLKWQGQCPHCQSWNTLIESIAEKPRFAPVSQSSETVSLSAVETGEAPRIATGISEFDRVLGGGLVPGGVVLLGGDPGIGKSTLLLQALAQLSGSNKTLYVSGAESAQQIALRAKRLNVSAK